MVSVASSARPRIMIGTPCFGGTVTCAFTMSLLNLQMAAAVRGIEVDVQLVGGDALVTRARNSIVGLFMADQRASHLLFIDADIGFHPDQVFALLEADKDVCGAIYPLKKVNWERLRAQALAGVANLQGASLNYVVDLLDETELPPAEDFLKVRYIGTGFMMIRRAVFERMSGHYPTIWYRKLHIARNGEAEEGAACAFFDCIIDPETGTYLSEDYTFCKRWTDMGGEIWAYTRSKLTHTGPITFEGDLGAMLELGRQR